MKINYRVLSYNEKDHSMTVRYWTDILGEDDLSLLFDEYNKIIYDSKGYPVRTKTDINITFYDNVNPSNEDIVDKIKLSAPTNWLQLMEKNKLSNTEYSLANVANFVDITDSFDTTTSNVSNMLIGQSSNTMNNININDSALIVEKAAKVAIRYIKTGVYELTNTSSYVV